MLRQFWQSLCSKFDYNSSPEHQIKETFHKKDNIIIYGRFFFCEPAPGHQHPNVSGPELVESSEHFMCRKLLIFSIQRRMTGDIFIPMAHRCCLTIPFFFVYVSFSFSFDVCELGVVCWFPSFFFASLCLSTEWVLACSDFKPNKTKLKKKKKKQTVWK